MAAMPMRELRRYLMFLASVVVSAFVPAGTFAWRNGWLFVVVMAALQDVQIDVHYQHAEELLGCGCQGTSSGYPG